MKIMGRELVKSSDQAALVERVEAVETANAEMRQAQKVAVGFEQALATTLKQLPKWYRPEIAMQLPAVQKAVSRLSNDVASLPIVVEDRVDDEWVKASDGDENEPGGREVRIVTEQWRPFESAALGVERVVRDLMLYGFACVNTIREGVQLRELVVEDPRDVERVPREGFGAMTPIDTLIQGVKVERGRIAVWYWSPPVDRFTRYPPLERGWNAVRAGLAATVFAAGYWDVAALGRILLKPPLDSPQQPARGVAKQDKDDDERRSEGRLDKTVLPRGWDVVIVPAEGRDAVGEMRAFAVREVSRLLGPPTVLLDDMDNSSYNNIKTSRTDYVTAFVSAWARKIGTELSRTIWPSGNRRMRLVVDQSALYSYHERILAYRDAINSGQLTMNEARKKEGEELIDTPEANALARTPMIPWPAPTEAPTDA